MDAVWIELLALQHGLAGHAQTIRRIVLAVLAAEVAVEDCLDEKIRAHAIAEAVEHRKAKQVAFVRHVDAVPVGFGSARCPRSAFRHFHGQGVFGVVEVARALDQGIGEVGSAGKHIVHGCLQNPR